MDTHRDKIKVVAERAVLVHVKLPRAYIDPDDPFSEIRALAETAGANVVGVIMQKRQRPSGRSYLGKGKVQELAALCEMTDATLVIFDNDLSPSQIRVLEEATERKIIDRSELILDIFANRATTHAARLQVEIAQLEYTFPRLRAMWDHLGQVTGGAPVGIGTRGPGEQQLEIDRRLVQRRLRQLRNELEGIQGRKTREVAQRNEDHYTVGLVGYTNAGKSTIFNRCTAGGAFAHDKLFATLSTRTERWDLGGGNHTLLSDTVGFIRNLPHHLVASFRSTLEDTIFAQLLLIVLDVSDPHAEMQLETVESTLDDVGATTQPRLLVLNKVDRLDDPSDLLVWLNKRPDAIPVSAVSGEGLDQLGAQVLDRMVGGVRELRISVPLKASRVVDFVEKRTEVLEREYTEKTVELTVKIGRRQVDQMLAQGAAVLINGRSPHDVIPELWPEPPRADGAGPGLPPHERFYASQS